MSSIQIMAHLVMGYPRRAATLEAARALADRGVRILELQIPFSDPTADGPINTQACETALKEGFRVSHAESYIQEAWNLGFSEVHVMTYANIPFRYTIDRYLRTMKDLGVTGVIVPDLPIEDEEGFYAEAARIGIDALPVAVVNMGPSRIELLRKLNPHRVYAALREGVTGRSTGIASEAKRFLSSLVGMKVYAGFGISCASQVAELEPHAYAAVIGSHITRAIGSGPDWYGQVSEAIGECIPG